MIELHDLAKTYGKGAAAVQALRDVNLTVTAGEFIAMMGPSDSGKSTCMNILGFLDTPSQGRYRFQDSAAEIMALLAQLNQQRGLTIIMITHEADIAAYAQRVVHFLDGCIQNEGRN